MAIISAYPVGTPASGDYLVGSDITTAGTQINPTKNFVISEVVATGLGYTRYSALLTQVGGAPTAVELKNDTGATMVWTRTGVGTYLCTASAPVFTATNKVQVFINPGKSSAGPGAFIEWESATTTTVEVTTYTLAGIAADDLLDNGAFEIRIYT